MAEPLPAGAAHATVACASPPVAVGAAGAVGAAAGVTELLLAEAGLASVPLLAITSKVYAVPLVSPVTATLVAPAAAEVVVAAGVVLVPTWVRTVYPVGVPPVVGAVQATVACALPAVASRWSAPPVP